MLTKICLCFKNPKDPMETGIIFTHQNNGKTPNIYINLKPGNTMTTLKKLVIILPILLGMGLFAFMKFNKQAPVRPGNKERVQTVRVIPLEKTHVVPRSIGYGYVEADRTWEAIP
ncbi:MAG: hypothetical protein GY857_19600, partial [Desulfobacula sp.]|nr:hypothetical protein [Desulfobacula sp.]